MPGPMAEGAAMNTINKYSCLPEDCILLVCYRKDGEKEEEGADNKGSSYKTGQIVTNTRENKKGERDRQ